MPLPFCHLLVPLDFTEKNEAALEMALQIARESEARLTLLHVIETIEHISDQEIEEFYAALEAKAETRLAATAKRFVDEGLSIRTQILFGRRGPEIVRYSMEQDVDLMVLSSHKIDLDQPAQGWSTLSYQTSILCQCPVLLIK